MLLSNVQFYCGRLLLSVATAQSGIVGPLAEVHCCGAVLVRKALFTVVADNARPCLPGCCGVLLLRAAPIVGCWSEGVEMGAVRRTCWVGGAAVEM